MYHIVYDLGRRRRGGSRVKVWVDRPAYLRLMSAKQYQQYREDEPYRYLGGRVTDSREVNLPVQAHWVAVVDLDGEDGEVDATLRVGRPRKRMK